jgi:competence protein ComFC
MIRWIWGSLDWLFPPVCGGCNRAGYRWCPDCQQQVQKVREPVCASCGLPLLAPGQCPVCQGHSQSYEMMRSWLVFDGPIRHALHNLKYRRNLALGETLAYHLDNYLCTLNWPINLVIPVPLGKERMKERGYNQVGSVALPLAMAHKWQYAPRALIRNRETRSQVGLTALERKHNVEGAFQANSAIVTGKNILLIDDVATTGATLASSSTALLDAGANSIYALTLARALPHHGFKIV